MKQKQEEQKKIKSEIVNCKTQLKQLKGLISNQEREIAKEEKRIAEEIKEIEKKSSKLCEKYTNSTDSLQQELKGSPFESVVTMMLNIEQLSKGVGQMQIRIGNFSNFVNLFKDLTNVKIKQMQKAIKQEVTEVNDEEVSVQDVAAWAKKSYKNCDHIVENILKSGIAGDALLETVGENSEALLQDLGLERIQMMTWRAKWKKLLSNQTAKVQKKRLDIISEALEQVFKINNLQMIQTDSQNPQMIEK